MQMIAEILPGRWALGLILGVVFGVWTTTAGASDLQSALAGLGAKRRSDIKQAVVALGTLNDPAALPALEATKNRKTDEAWSSRLNVHACNNAL